MSGIGTIISRLKYIKREDVLGFVIYILIFPISLIARVWFKLINKKIWIISENGDCMTACDNGFNFFEYLYKNNMEYAYFAINKRSPYFEKMTKYKNKILIRGTFRHWIYYLCADKRISTHTLSAPSLGIFYALQKLKFTKHNTVFLQHGVTYNNIPSLYYENCNIDLFICGAKKEYDYIISKFHYPDSIAKYTGFARFDKLHNVKVKMNQIAVIPTWRRWIAMDLKNDDDFINTEYYQNYQRLLNDSKLRRYLTEHKLLMIFYLHQSMDRFLKYFKSDSQFIIVASRKEYDIQKLLSESALLVTDYSSLFFDFAYMKKPIIYFQFDKEKFRESQYEEGYFSYKSDAFGPVCYDVQSVIANMIKAAENSMQMGSIYRRKVDDFFILNDDKNCQRIFEAIKNM